MQEAEEAHRIGSAWELGTIEEKGSMRKLGMRAALSGGLIAAALFAASGASAATLIGDYQLQGNRASAVPGPSLSDIAPGNSFQTDNVMGTTRQVLAFPIHSGVQMLPSVGSGNPAYSVVTTFRLDAVDGYRRILDPSNGTSDTGFYAWDGYARYSGSGLLGPNVVFANGVYATVAITSLPSPAQTKVYVNGSLQLNASQTEPVVANTLNFFKDNTSGGSPGEESGGAVSCVRVYSGALTDDDVARIGASPTCGTVSTTTLAKKCKKHKKRRSAESAKKKKCKKRKRR
jgi:hypothetical protein